MAPCAMTERCDRSHVLRKTYRNRDCPDTSPSSAYADATSPQGEACAGASAPRFEPLRGTGRCGHRPLREILQLEGVAVVADKPLALHFR